MKTNTNRVTVALVLAVILLMALYFVVRYTVNVQNRDTIATLDTTILNQEKLLISLSEATRANGADEATQRIIVDCSSSERQQFDTLLDRLQANISRTELNELNTLFYKCGSFYSDRKSVMASRLIREVEIFADYIKLRDILRDQTTVESAKLIAWQNLAEAELKVAEYFNQLVVLQGTIIGQLNSGKSATSKEVEATLTEVSSVRGQMLVLGTQIDTLKSEALAI